MIPPQIPASVDVEDVRAFCKKVGLELEDVESLRIEYYGLHVSLFAKSDDGKKMAAGREVAIHQVFIPFKGEEASDDDRPSGQR